MNVSEITSTLVPVLKPTDTARFAMDRMLESRLFDLPVVDEQGNYLGLVGYEALEEQEEDLAISHSKPAWQPLSVRAEDAVLRLLNSLQNDQLTAMPVVDEQGVYLYAVQIHDVVVWMAAQSMLAQPGGLITLLINSNNYSLSEIARIAESNNGSIVNLRISEAREPDQMLVHLKFNLVDLTYVMATFERFGYHIVAFHHQSHLDDLYSERYDALMRYLDI